MSMEISTFQEFRARSLMQPEGKQPVPSEEKVRDIARFVWEERGGGESTPEEMERDWHTALRIAECLWRVETSLEKEAATGQIVEAVGVAVLAVLVAVAALANAGVWR